MSIVASSAAAFAITAIVTIAAVLMLYISHLFGTGTNGGQDPEPGTTWDRSFRAFRQVAIVGVVCSALTLSALIAALCMA